MCSDFESNLKKIQTKSERVQKVIVRRALGLQRRPAERGTPSPVTQQNKMDHVSSSTTNKDGKQLAILSKRMQNLEPDTKGTRPLFRLGADSGYRNIGLALGVAWRQLADFDPNWEESALVDKEEYPDNPAPVHILAVVYADLVPTNSWDEDIEIVLYTSPLLRRYNKRVDAAFDEKLDDLYNRLRQSPSMTKKMVDRAVEELDAKSTLLTVQYATEYTLGVDSAHHLTRQLIKLIMNPSMRWLWTLPGGVRMENQLDQIYNGPKNDYKIIDGKKYWYMGENYSPKSPVIWYISHLMQGLIMQMDVLLFGMARECRLSAAKYGLDNEPLAATTHAKHPRITDPHSFRKQMSIESAVVTLYALGQHDLVYWLVCTLKDQGRRAHDAADAINLVLASFNTEIRTNNYSKVDEAKIRAFLDKLKRYRTESVQVAGARVLINTDDPFDDEALERLQRFIRKEKDLAQRKGKLLKPLSAAEKSRLGTLPGLKGTTYANRQVSVADRAAALLGSKQSAPITSFMVPKPAQSTTTSLELSSEDLAALEDIVMECYGPEAVADPAPLPTQPQPPRYKQGTLKPLLAPAPIDYFRVDADGFDITDDEVLPTPADRKKLLGKKKRKKEEKSVTKKRKRNFEDGDIVDISDDDNDGFISTKGTKQSKAAGPPAKKRLKKCSEAPPKKQSRTSYTDEVRDIVVNTNVGGRRFNQYDDDDDDPWGDDNDGFISTAKRPSTYSSDKKYSSGQRNSKNTTAYHTVTFSRRDNDDGGGGGGGSKANKGDGRTMSDRLHSFVD
jgi:hypothetical protein